MNKTASMPPVTAYAAALLHKYATVFSVLFVVAATYVFSRPYIYLAEQMGFKPMLWFVAEREIYRRTVLAVNYFSDGFVRRGLGGTIAHILSTSWATSTLLFIIFSFAWLILPLALLVRRLARSLHPIAFCYIAAVVLISPQTFFGWSRDPARTDLMVAGFIAWSVLATLAGRRWLAMLLILTGSLAHETAVIYGAPILLMMNWHDQKAGELDLRTCIRMAAAFVGGLALILLLQHFLSPPGPVVAEHMLREAPSLRTNPEYRLWRDIAIYMAVAGSDALRTALCHNYSINPQYGFTAIACMIVLLAYAFILPLRRRPLIVLIAMCVPVIFMLLIANDTGRWLKLGVLNGWLISAFYLLRHDLQKELRGWWMGLGGVLLLVLLGMGHTPYNHVNRVTHGLALRLGYKDPGSLGVWMDRCAPDWRRIVYGVDGR